MTRSGQASTISPGVSESFPDLVARIFSAMVMLAAFVVCHSQPRGRLKGGRGQDCPPYMVGGLLVQDRNIFCGRGLRYGLEIRVDVLQFLVGYDLFRIRRHFTCRLANVFREGRERDWVRREARACSAVAVVVVTLVTAVAIEDLFAILRVGGLRREDGGQGQ